eukprot:4014058-Pleurochrysis_carterae.AAC.1
MCVLYISGFCKAELVAYLPERATWLTRASLLWLIGVVSTKHPKPQQLQALSVGDRCENSPRQSKCDATGGVWGDRPMALVYIDVPGNAAKVLAHLELAFPFEASVRESVPLLTADNANPLTPSLQCAGCLPHPIQALCRWQSPNSLTFYCRVEASIYERWQSA